MRTHQRWTVEEMEMIRAAYEDRKGRNLNLAIPGRTAHEIRSKAYMMRLKRVTRFNRSSTGWSQEELERLKVEYPNAPASRLVRLFLGRSLQAIHLRAHILGIKRNPGTNDSLRRPATIPIPTDPLVLAYAAGIIDGEGCIMRHADHSARERQRGRTAVRISYAIHVGNTSLPLIQWLHSQFGGHWWSRNHRGHPNWKPFWEWRVSGNSNTLALLRAIRPYMIVKTDAADRAIAILETGLPVLVPAEKGSAGE